MQNLNINEKINVRSNMDFEFRRSKDLTISRYKIAEQHKNNPKSMYYDGVLYYSVMPKNTQKQLLKNKNFQRSWK